MLIKADLFLLSGVIGHLAQLSDSAINIADSLNESMGNATDAERAVILRLNEICKSTFPMMVDSSRRLISSISEGFKAADQ